MSDEPGALSPAAWGAAIDYDGWADPVDPKDKIVAHYGGGTQRRAYDGPEAEASILRAWERYHLGRGWRGLAYGWAVGMSGTLYRARGWNRYGAHRGDYEPDQIPENREAVPVVFILGGDQEPTARALRAFEDLRRHLEATEGRELLLIGHQEIAQRGTGTRTACPGKMMHYVRAHRWAPQEVTRPVPEYKTVKNVPDQAWARRVVDHFEAAGVLKLTDDRQDDWNEPIEVGQLLTFLQRFEEHLVRNSLGHVEESERIVAAALQIAADHLRGET